jgi:hypothetical protein
MANSTYWSRVNAGLCWNCGVVAPVAGERACAECKKLSQAKQKRLRDPKVINAKLLALYGSRCVCCGESNPLFLTLDHKHNDGHKEKDKGTVRRTAARIKRDDLQMMCFNCNCGKNRNSGVCPHNTTGA